MSSDPGALSRALAHDYGEDHDNWPRPREEPNKLLDMDLGFHPYPIFTEEFSLFNDQDHENGFISMEDHVKRMHNMWMTIIMNRIRIRALEDEIKRHKNMVRQLKALLNTVGR